MHTGFRISLLSNTPIFAQGKVSKLLQITDIILI